MESSIEALPVEPSQADSDTPKPVSRLDRLPPEIYTMIVRLVFNVDEVCLRLKASPEYSRTVVLRHRSGLPANCAKDLYPIKGSLYSIDVNFNALLACKSLSIVGLPFLYTNTFSLSLDWINAFQNQFLPTIGLTNSLRIKEIEIEVWPTDRLRPDFISHWTIPNAVAMPIPTSKALSAILLELVQSPRLNLRKIASTRLWYRSSGKFVQPEVTDKQRKMTILLAENMLAVKEAWPQLSVLDWDPKGYTSLEKREHGRSYRRDGKSTWDEIRASIGSES